MWNRCPTYSRYRMCCREDVENGDGGEDTLERANVTDAFVIPKDGRVRGSYEVCFIAHSGRAGKENKSA